jgi:hypothetical protein
VETPLQAISSRLPATDLQSSSQAEKPFRDPTSHHQAEDLQSSSQAEKPFQGQLNIQEPTDHLVASLVEPVKEKAL